MTWQRIDDDTYIDDTLVTCAEYQLFIDEIPDQRPDRNNRQWPPPHWRRNVFVPIHWHSNSHPPGQATYPILGVRSFDAQSFCDWLTLKAGSEWRFRLPRLYEAQVNSIQWNMSTPVGYWVTTQEDSPKFIWGSNIRPMPMQDELLKRLYDNFVVEGAVRLARRLSNIGTTASVHSPIDDLLEPAEDIAHEIYELLSKKKNMTIDSQIIKNPEEMVYSIDRAIDLANKYFSKKGYTFRDSKGGWTVSAKDPNEIVYYDEVVKQLREWRNRAESLVRLLGIIHDVNHGFEVISKYDAIRIPNFSQPSKSDGNYEPYCNPKHVFYYVNDFDSAINLALDMTEIQSRSEGHSPAFEGIRLVKERIK